jgi:hypothetical protein
MADPSRDQLAPIEAQFNAHPAIQAYFRSGKRNPLAWVRAVGQASRDLGIEIPHDYQPEQRNGQVKLEKRSFLQRNPWVMPAVAVGAPLATGAALGAFGGAAAAGAGGAGGVGVGETGAVTGLAGSGFGAGGGAAALPAAVTGASEVGAGGALARVGRLAARAAPTVIPAIGQRLTGGDDGGRSGGTPPELQEILNLQKQRMLMQNPLYESILKLAQSRLPTSAQQGPRMLPTLTAPAAAQPPMASDPMQQAVQRLAATRRLG